jgi:NAD+ kinase
MTLSTVGVVGDGVLTDRVRETAESESATVVHDSASEVLDAEPEAVVAVGEAALLELVRASVSVPVLPIAAGPGYGGVSLDDASTTSSDSASELLEAERVTSAVENLLAGAFETDSRALLGVSVGEEYVGPALADVMLVATEPARISEYAIRSRDEEVAKFRADGVVVSTPTGSHGYGRSAGGPLLEPGSGVLGVVPIAPFAVNADHWVLSADRPVTLSVERDEGEMSLLVDDQTVRSVSPHTPVEVVEDGSLPLVRVPESRPFFER